MKGIKIFLLVVLITLILLAFLIKRALSKLEYEYKISKFNIREIFKGKLGISLDFIIKNKNSFPITIGKVYLELYYQNVLIAKTPKVIPNTQIKANSATTIKDFYLDLYLNKESGEIIKKYLAKQPITFQFKTKFSLFGIGIPINFIPMTEYTYSDYEA